MGKVYHLKVVDREITKSILKCPVKLRRTSTIKLTGKVADVATGVTLAIRLYILVQT
jgi:hypothetical protein